MRPRWTPLEPQPERLPRLDVAAWDGEAWTCLGAGIDGELSPGVLGLHATGDELVAVGGDFTTAGGKPSTNIALWHIPHSLTLRQNGDWLELSWPATGTNFILETATTLPATQWEQVPGLPMVISNRLVVERLLEGFSRFYRLRKRSRSVAATSHSLEAIPHEALWRARDTASPTDEEPR